MRKRIGCLALALALCLTLLPPAALAVEDDGAGAQADSSAERADAVPASGGADEMGDETGGAGAAFSIVSGPDSKDTITKTYGEKFSLTFAFNVPDDDPNRYIKITYKVGSIGGIATPSSKQYTFTFDAGELSVGNYEFSFTAEYRESTIQSDTYQIRIEQADMALQAAAFRSEDGTSAADAFTYGDTLYVKGTLKRQDAAADTSEKCVEVSCGDKTLGAREVSGEAFTIPVDTRKLGAGPHTLAVRYAGSQNLKKAEAAVDVPVSRKPVTPEIRVSGTYTYTGQEITPNFQVYDGDTEIPADEYTYEVTNNTEPGTGDIQITDAEGGNYEIAGATQPFSIEKAVYTGAKTMETTVPDAAKDNNPLTLPELPKPSEGAHYALKGLSAATKEGAAGSQTLFPADAVTWVDGNTLTFKTMKLEAGYSATMTFSVKDAKYYQDYDVVVTVKVVERPQKQLAVSMSDWTYGDTPDSPEFTAPDGILDTPAITYEKKDASGGYTQVSAPTSTTDAGDYRVTVRCETSDEIFVGAQPFTIAPRSIEGAAVTAPALTYTGTPQSIADGTTVTLDGTPLVKDTDFRFDGTFSADKAGSYRAQVQGIGNYSGCVDVPWKIDPKTVTADVTINGGPFTYTGSEIRPAVTVKDGETTIPDTEYTLSYSSNQNAGMGTVTVVDREGGNYTVSGQAQFEIKQADQLITAAPLSAVYGEQGRTLTVTGAQGQLAYAVKPGGEDILSVSADGVLTFKKAGTAVVLITAAETHNYKPSDTVEVPVAVAKAAAVIRAADRSAYIGAAAPDLNTPKSGTDYTVSGLVGGDQPEGVTVSLAYASQPDMSKAGTFVIRPSVAGTDDRYDFACEDGTLTVALRPSSGGGSGRTTYPVNAPAANHGTVTVSPKNAAKGDTVTITVKPDSGYVLGTIAVADQNGNQLTWKDAGDGRYTFPMPAGKIEVKADFVESGASGAFDDVPEDAYYAKAVEWAVENGITNGKGNGLFGSNDPCTRAQIVTFLWRAAGSPVVNYLMPFTDVDEGAYYAEAVRWAASTGIVTGLTETAFGTDQPCTRGQAVTFLFRAIAGDAVTLQELVSGYDDAVDVPGYALPAMNWALFTGVVQGSGGRLLPDHTCTRAQIVTFLYRAYQGKV